MSRVPTRRGFSVAHVGKRERMGPVWAHSPSTQNCRALVLPKAHGDYVVGVTLGLSRAPAADTGQLAAAWGRRAPSRGAEPLFVSNPAWEVDAVSLRDPTEGLPSQASPKALVSSRLSAWPLTLKEQIAVERLLCARQCSRHELLRGETPARVQAAVCRQTVCFVPMLTGTAELPEPL